MKKPQEQTILEHLRKHHSITSWEAIQKYGITRLADRIFKLKKAGHDIETVMKYPADGSRFGIYLLKDNIEIQNADKLAEKVSKLKDRIKNLK